MPAPAGHQRHGAGRQHEVFAPLYAAHVEHEARRQRVAAAHVGKGFGGYVGGKGRVAPLVNHVDFALVDAVVVHQLALGKLAHGYHPVGHAAGAAELVVVYHSVYGVVVFGAMDED